MPQSHPANPIHIDEPNCRRASLWKRPSVWIASITLLVVISAAFLLLRGIFVTKTWDGYMLFRVTSVSQDFVDIDSVSGTAESPDGSAPLTEHVHDYISVLPGVVSGATVRCRVRQTYRVNTDFDTGPRSVLTDCASVVARAG